MNKLLALALIPLFAFGFYTTERLGRFDVVQESQPKVVKIGIVAASGSWIGSGAFISPEGLILTCAHLFGHKTDKIFVKTASGQTYLARLVRVDHTVDLAVLKIDALKPFPYFRLGADPYIGEPVMEFGSPLEMQGTVTFGYVENLEGGPSKYTIQGCPNNPGNSGGPLVDYSGRLVGVNVAMLMLNPFQIAQGLNLAVNMPTIRTFVRQ